MTPHKNAYVLVRLSRWSHAKLSKIRDELAREIKARPEDFPYQAGRRLTFSDVIMILSKEWESMI